MNAVAIQQSRLSLPQAAARRAWTPAIVQSSVDPYGSWLVFVNGRIVASGEHQEDLEDDFVEWLA